jgi:hypothetical protein
MRSLPFFQCLGGVNLKGLKEYFLKLFHEAGFYCRSFVEAGGQMPPFRKCNQVAL